MSASPVPPAESRVLALMAQLDATMAELAELEDWPMSDVEVLRTADHLYGHQAKVAARALRLVAEIDTRGLAPDAGSPTTAAWLTARLRQRPSTSKKQVTLARSLAKHEPTAAALASGAVNVEQADVICQAIDALPGRIDTETLAEAEQTLLAQAAAFPPARLAAIGAHLAIVLDPDGPEPDESEPDPTPYFFDLHTRADGACEGAFLLDPVTALTLKEMIDAGSGPRPSTADGPDLRSAARRRADALSEIVHRAAASPEPRIGANRFTIAVTVTLDQLRDGLPALGPDGELLTAATVRRMACDAEIIPAVLGSPSEVLDIGRRSRSIPVALRRALIVRDKGCAFPGCDRPASWTEAHHVVHWAHHGETVITNLVLLCAHHHDTVHHRGWKVRINHHGLPEFTPPAWLRAA